MTKTRALALATLVTVAALVAVPGAGAGGGGREIVKRGGCSGAATWKLKLKADNGRIETEFEVDQNRNGRRWRVTLFRNGTQVFQGIRTTTAPSGSFELRRLLANGAGPDRIVARAVALRNGQTCRGAATF
jgi:hypothetical protein